MTRRRISPAVPPGVQTFLFEETQARTAVADAVFRAVQGWSYGEIVFPVFDYFDVFARGAGPSLIEKTFRFIDREGQLLAVRSDFTPLVARTVATRLAEEPLPLRICYRGDVVRHEGPHAGAQSDFWQIGAELIGVPGVDGTLEVLAVAADAVDAIGVDDFILSLGHVGVLDALLAEAGVGAGHAETVRRAIDRKDPHALQRALDAVPGLDGSAAEWLRRLPGWYGSIEVLDDAHAAIDNAAVRAALDELREVCSVFEAAGLPGRIAVDLGDVRGTGYYTGVKFQIVASGIGAPLGGGGRYDDLIGRFGDAKPAVGFSLSLDRLVEGANGALRSPAPADGPRDVELAGDRAAALRDAHAARRRGETIRLKGPA